MGDEQQVLTLLDKLEGEVKDSSTIVENEKAGTLTAITNLRTDLNNTELQSRSANSSKPKPEDIANLIDSLTVITDNIKNFTSKDPIKITQGVINIIGGIGSVVAGPYGPIVAAGCGLISSVLSLFGGGGPSLAEQLEEIIDQALEDFKDQEIYEDIQKSIIDMRTTISQMVGMARYNGGIVTEGEKSYFTEAQITLVGNDTLGVLKGQLDNYKEENGDESKCKRLASYTYSYANMCVYKHVLLNIHIGLLRRNDMESMAQGVINYLTNELPSQGKGAIGFMSSLPDPKGCNYWRLFRCLHNDLGASQRYVLSTYRQVIKLEPIPGQLVCLFNKSTKGYTYAPDYEYNDQRRYSFRWGEGSAEYDSLYRIVGEDNDHLQIFSVWFGEYLYASANTYNSERRYVLTWRPGGISEINEASWSIHGDWDVDCSIKNVKYNEYLYSSTIAQTDKRYLNFCWTPGNLADDAKWQILPVSYETTLNLNEPMK